MVLEAMFADNNRCRVCPSTDTMLSPHLMRKRFARENNLMKKPSKPFKLEMIPEDVQSMILTKMDQISFTRMRRTNDYFSAYIDKNRHFLKPALFHNWKLRSEDKDCVNLTRGLSCDAFFVIGKNFQEDDIDESMKSSIDLERKISNMGLSFCNNEVTQHQRAVKIDVKLYLKAVKLDKWLQKELTGVMKLNEFSMNGFYTPVVEAYWTDFLTSRMIESVSLDLSSVSPQLINCCLQTLRPEKLEFKAEEEIVELGENLKEVKKLFVTRTRMNWNYGLLRNVEELIVSDPYDMPGSYDVIKMLEMWCAGESNLREMTYSLCQGASKTALHTLNGEEVTDFYAEWLVNRGALKEMVWKAFHQDRNMTRGDPPEGFMLTQNVSMKIAVCVYYKDHVFFKTKEVDDQESGNRWL